MFFTSNLLREIKKESVGRLSGIYKPREAENIVNRLIDSYLGLSRVGQQLNPDKRLSEAEVHLFREALRRLLAQEPLQYVLGAVEFYGLSLKVGSGVLIPRPETEQLVELIVNTPLPEQCRVLDVGTGSGCIPLALKSVKRDWKHTGVDVSAEALALAKENAALTGLSVDFRKCDVLKTEECRQVMGQPFHLIVSNPPYVREQEKSRMAGHVLQYEPWQALFVPDDDPLLFYQKISELARQVLLPGGWLFLELNENLAEETAGLFLPEEYPVVEIVTDFRGKERFLRARKKS